MFNLAVVWQQFSSEIFRPQDLVSSKSARYKSFSKSCWDVL
jgi:hypothetical protein